MPGGRGSVRGVREAYLLHGLLRVAQRTGDRARQKRIRNKQIAYFGSYGWSGGARRELEQLAEGLKWDLVDTLEFHGGPTEELLHKAAQFGARFAELVQSSDV